MGQKLQEGKRVSMNAKTITPPESKGSTSVSALFAMKCGDIVQFMYRAGMSSDWALSGGLSSVKLVIGRVAIRFKRYWADYHAIVGYRTV